MIPSSRLAAVFAVAAAFGLHGMALTDFSGTDSVKIAGGASVSVAALGNSFADMVAGTASPVKPTQTDTPRPPDPVDPVEPELVKQTEPPESADKPPTETLTQPTPDPTDQPDLTKQETAPVASTPVVQSEPIMQVSPLTPVQQTAVPDAAQTQIETSLLASVPVVVDQTAPIDDAVARLPESATVDPTTAPTPVSATVPKTVLQELQQAVQPTPPVVVKTQKPAELAKQQVAVVTSVTSPLQDTPTPAPAKLRPVARPVETKLQTAPPPKPAPKAKPKPPKPRPATAKSNDNSNRNAKKGSETGKQDTGGARSGQKAKRSTAQGNAAKSNYPGIVFRKISRAKRQKVKIKGAVRISFRIAGNGGLAGISVARSSGSQKLDQIALAQVRRASPFPAPPAGARTSFSVEIRGR